MNNLIIIYSNALLWLFTLIYWWRKKRMNVGVVVLAIYTAIACMSCHLYQIPNQEFNWGEVFAFPLLYLYVTITLLIYPLFKIDYNKISIIKLPPIKVINIICFYIVICSIWHLISSLPNIENGLNLMLIDDSYAIDAYLDTTEANMQRKSLSGGTNFLAVSISTGFNFSMLFFFIYLLYPNRNKWLQYGLTVSLLITPLSSLASGSREKVICVIIVFAFMFILLRPFLPKKTNRIITTFSVTATALFMMLFFIISLARANGDYDNLIYNTERYFSQSFLVFDGKCMFANGTREGNLVSPLINVLTGGSTYSQTELRNKYASLGIDNGTFYTFVGDFVLDYGPIFAFIILALIAYFFNSKLNVKGTLTIGHVILYFILLKLLSGFYLHQFPGIGGNLYVIELALLYIWFTNNQLNTIKRSK